MNPLQAYYEWEADTLLTPNIFSRSVNALYKCTDCSLLVGHTGKEHPLKMDATCPSCNAPRQFRFLKLARRVTKKSS